MFEGPVLMDHLEDVPLGSDVAEDEPFRMAVQWVNRPDQHFRGFAGMINQGVVRPGDPVRAAFGQPQQLPALSALMAIWTAQLVASPSP